MWSNLEGMNILAQVALLMFLIMLFDYYIDAYIELKRIFEVHMHKQVPIAIYIIYIDHAFLYYSKIAVKLIACSF